MLYFNIHQERLFYDFSIIEQEKKKIDEFLRLLEISGVGKILKEAKDPYKTGPIGFNKYDVFAAILYGFMIGKSSLRELESACCFDTRFMYIMDFEKPTYVTFANYINDIILPNSEKIFVCLTQAMLKQCRVNMETVFIDGTKIEADANKYKFVWKPTTFHKKLDSKIRNLLSIMGNTRGLPSKDFITSKELSDIISRFNFNGNSDDKIFNEQISNLVGYLNKVIEYEEKERICGPNRKSFYKTDHDATAMCLKNDYYAGLGSSMHAAYQEQIAVSHGLIVAYYVSQDRSDMSTFRKTMDFFIKNYGFYPKNVCADAGYGCEDTYQFCKDNNIRAFIKYQSWDGECSGKNPAVYELNDDNTITCLGGNKGMIYECADRHPKYSGGVFYRVEGCSTCSFSLYCKRFMNNKDDNFKIFEIRPSYQRLKQETRDLLLTPEGIEMRVNRSCQVEGAFGVIKEDFGYVRSRRISLEKVTNEFMLVTLGYNLRKYLKFKITGKGMNYWKAPSILEPEKFKKPSAKRLTNRMMKKNEKEPNEIAKSGCKY